MFFFWTQCSGDSLITVQDRCTVTIGNYITTCNVCNCVCSPLWVNCLISNDLEWPQVSSILLYFWYIIVKHFHCSTEWLCNVQSVLAAFSAAVVTGFILSTTMLVKFHSVTVCQCPCMMQWSWSHSSYTFPLALLAGEDLPTYQSCSLPLTVKHMDTIRHRFFKVSPLLRIFLKHWQTYQRNPFYNYNLA